MNKPKIALAYCIDNIKVAEEIDSRISESSPYRFEHIYCKKAPEESSIPERLSDHDGPILLLISDNFLKSAQCMKKGLPFLQRQGSQILPIITDGFTTDENGKVVAVPTDFERVSDIIQYINYWQDQYLDLRRQKRQLKGLDEEKFNAHLKVMREISSEAGEFLRLLRNMDCVPYATFSADHFKRFFEFLDDTARWESFRHEDQKFLESRPEQAPDEEEEVDITGIPGLDLIDNQEEVAGEEASEEEPSPEKNRELTSEPEFVISDEEEEDDDYEVEEEEEDELEEDEEDDNEEEVEELIEEASRFANMGEWHQAIAMLSDGVEEYPDHTYLRYRYALTLAQRQERIPDAMEQLYSLLEIDPDHSSAQFLMGELAELRGEFKKARKYYEQVAYSQPNHPDIYYRLGIVVSNHFPDENERAAAYFKQAFEKNPGNVDAIYQYAMLLNEALGKPDASMEYFRNVLDKQKDHPFANYDLALLHHRRDEQEKARNYYLQAIRINPELQTEENDIAFGVHEQEEIAAVSEEPPAEQREEEWEINGREEEETGGAEEKEEEQVVAEQEETTTSEEAEEEGETTPLSGSFYETASSPASNGSATESSQPEEEEASEDPLEALKNNIKRLEEMLKRRKTAAPVEPKKKGEGKVVMITGATSGIGRATAKEFAENGYRLILTGRRQERLDRLQKIFEDLYHSEVKTLCFDVRRVEEIEASFEKQLDFEWRQVDILINNAGKAKGLDPIHRGRLEHWEEMIDTNIKGLLYMTRAVVPNMINRRNGHIINLASTAGKEVYPSGNVYCATKFAVEALTKAMRLDLVKYNIRVSQVSPGHVEHTEFANVRFDGDEDRSKIYEDFIPLNARDVAEAIYFIATRPRHVNIQDILMTGTQQAGATAVDRRGRDMVNFFIDKIKS